MTLSVEDAKQIADRIHRRQANYGETLVGRRRRAHLGVGRRSCRVCRQVLRHPDRANVQWRHGMSSTMSQQPIEPHAIIKALAGAEIKDVLTAVDDAMPVDAPADSGVPSEPA